MSNATTTIREFESVRVVSARDPYIAFVLEVRQTNAVMQFYAYDLMGLNPGNAHTRNQIFVTGPAEIVLVSRYAQRPPASVEAAYVTLEIVPESFPPDKAIVIPAGGGANVALECSTNLIDWVSASPGIYTNVPAAKFFRIKAERVP